MKVGRRSAAACFKRLSVTGIAALILVLSTGCASVPNPTPGDPFESANRTIFKFNDALDRTLFQPVARGYVRVMPRFVRTGVTNFFGNLGDAYSMVNDYLQGKVLDGTQDLMRFAINTVFGLGGVLDFASAARLPRHDQDFGLTLGHYGVKPGPYLVLPLLGPSNVRDGVGRVADYFADPINYLNPAWLAYSVYSARIVNLRALLLGASDMLNDVALDPYSFMRSAYLQQRQYKIDGSSAPPPDYPDDPDTGK
jgi:phospholipid-binding lipoprotein MlaA